MKNRIITLRKEKGISLIEVTVAVFLIASMSALMAQFTSNSLKMYKTTMLSNQFEESVTKIIREFEFTTRAGFNVEVAKPRELVFYRFYDSEAIYPDKIHYFIEKDGDIYSFKVGHSEYSGSLDGDNKPIYNSENITLIIDQLVFASDTEGIFEYYKYNNDPIVCEGAICDGEQDVINKYEIRSIALTVTIGGNPIDPNKNTTQSTKIKLRNINAT